MKISVIGSGYVGLVAGAGLAHLGHHVTCVDIDQDRIDSLESLTFPIHEPGLEDLVRAGRASELLSFSTNLSVAIAKADIVMIAVGTPQSDDGSACLRAIKETAIQIGDNLHGFTVVVCKSTVPVGTCDLVHRLIDSRTDQPFEVVSNPEFLREGQALSDFLHPERIIIGSNDADVQSMMRQCYAPLFNGDASSDKFICMDSASAELCKYTANAYLATRIAFVNEIAGLCEKVGADITRVTNGAGSDPRIGLDYFQPGPGFGGSCLPKDLDALLHTAHKAGAALEIPRAVKKSNIRQREVPVEKLQRAIAGELGGCTVAIWGLSFKPETDDVRESPALSIVNQLIDAGATVRAHDPVAIDNFRQAIPRPPEFYNDPFHALEGADALMIVTDWAQYRELDLAEVATAMVGNVIVDCRNTWADRQIPASLSYHGIGVPAKHGLGGHA